MKYHPLLDFLLRESSVNEIMINKYNSIFVDRNLKIEKVNASFKSEKELYEQAYEIAKFLEKDLNETSPILDAMLPEGARINITIPPVSVTGPTITIRKFQQRMFSLDSLATAGTINDKMARFLYSCVQARINIIISGGTGAGKTTLLNALIQNISPQERLVIIEDTPEMQITNENTLRMQTRPASLDGKIYEISIRDLIKNSLRQRPDRIIVGECRGPEAYDMLQAMNTGHNGSITTLHANSTKQAITRLENLVYLTGMDFPIRVLRKQISDVVNLIVQIRRFRDGTRKITEILEITGMEGDTITRTDIFKYRVDGFDKDGKVMGEFETTGFVPSFIEKIRGHGEIF